MIVDSGRKEEFNLNHLSNTWIVKKRKEKKKARGPQALLLDRHYLTLGHLPETAPIAQMSLGTEVSLESCSPLL